MRGLRLVVASTLAPVILTEWFGEQENAALAMPPEHSRQHVPTEPRGESFPTLTVRSVTGSNSTASTVTWSYFGNGFTLSPSHGSSSQESSPAPPIVISGKPTKTRDESRAKATKFPSLQNRYKDAFLRSTSPPHAANKSHHKRFLFGCP